MILSAKNFSLIKREFFSEISRKCLKITGKYSLAVCGLLCGEKQFLLILIPFYWFDQKKLFKQIQISLLAFTYSNLFTKTNFLCISVILSEIVFFGLNSEFFSELAQKCFKTSEKHSLAVCGSFWGENQFLLIFVSFYCFERKGLFTTNPNFPLDLTLFKLVEKNTLSNFFWASFRDSHIFD